uniref:DEP domain-containing protein n=1 Tax=Globodera rostochiensis TaxID=31243 RepID=A0A914IDJ9_GLORO
MQVQQKATPSASIIKQDQFEATRKWRLALKKFYEGMPLLTHRRQLRSYSETFTGKDAVDFAERIFPTVFSKCCDRESARSLLEKFLSFGYIINVRGESSKTFFDNATLYRFCNERVTQMLRKEQEDESIRRRSTLLKRANDTNMKEELSNMAKLNGRLSISCQDISTIEKQNNLSAAKKSFGAGMLSNLVSIGRASATLFSLNRSNSDSARARQQRRCNAIVTNSKSLCDSVLREKCTNRVGVEMECESMRLINNKMCGISQSVFKTASSSCTTTVKFLPQKIVRHRTAMASKSLISEQCQATNIVFTEADEFRFWRSALVNWFGDTNKFL